MKIVLLLMSGILGTMVMTSFSHLIEVLTGNKFNEAHLLNELINRLKLSNVNFRNNQYLGWIIHFAIGICMAVALDCYYKYSTENVTFWMAVGLGVVLGLIGVIGWLFMINFHSSPPKIEWNYFFVQLVIAHIIFSVTATLVLTKFGL